MIHLTMCVSILSLKLKFHSVLKKGFPGSSDSKESTCNAGDLGLLPVLGRSPGKGIGNLPVFLPGKSHGQRILGGYSPWGPEESDMTEQLSTHIFKKKQPIPLQPNAGTRNSPKCPY